MKLEERLRFFKDKGYKYNPESGLVTSPKGNIIKSNTRGYIKINTTFQKKCISVSVHHFGWYIYHNEIPIEIDHIDRNKSNNKISNLRLITHQKNSFNTYAKGYYLDKRTNKYYAQIRLNNKSISVGTFNNEEDARQAYLDAKKIYHNIDK